MRRYLILILLLPIFGSAKVFAVSEQAYAYCTDYRFKLGFRPQNTNLCGTPADRYAQTFVPEFLNEFATATNLSKPPLSKEAQNRFAPHFARIKEQVAGACCLRSETCVRALNEVPVVWCDDCKDGTHFRVSKDERRLILYRVSLIQSSPRLPLRQKWLPLLGKISMSTTASNIYSTETNVLANFRHEMWHVCDSVRAQQMLATEIGQNLSLVMNRMVHAVHQNGYCERNDKLNQYYMNLLADYGVGPGFWACIEKVYVQQAEVGHELFCRSRCPGAMNVEVFAKALEVLNAHANQSPQFWHSACDSSQDGYHVGSSEILQCLIESNLIKTQN